MLCVFTECFQVSEFSTCGFRADRFLSTERSGGSDQRELGLCTLPVFLSGYRVILL